MREFITLVLATFMLQIGWTLAADSGCGPCKKPITDPYERRQGIDPCEPKPDGPIHGEPCKECKGGEIEYITKNTPIGSCRKCDGQGNTLSQNRDEACPKEYDSWESAYAAVDRIREALRIKRNECEVVTRALSTARAELALAKENYDAAVVQLFAMRARYAVQCGMHNPSTEECKRLESEIREGADRVTQLAQAVNRRRNELAEAEKAAAPCLSAIESLHEALATARSSCRIACAELSECLRSKGCNLRCQGCPS